MILRKLQQSPERMIPVAMTFVVVGLSILLIGIAWPRFLPPVAHAGTDLNDFLRGLIFGIAIAFEVIGVVLAATAAAKKRNPL
jgi:hypothetical protein